MILCAGNKENLKYFTSKDYQSSVLNKLWNNLIDFKIEKIGGTQNTLTDAMRWGSVAVDILSLMYSLDILK